MSTEKRMITNESGKSIIIMIDPANTIQHIHSEVEWTITASQWRRIVRESDDTAWSTERGATLIQDIYPDLTTDQREFLKTGICDDCWQSL